MFGKRLFVVSFIIAATTEAATAFIFNTDDSDSVTLMNHNDKCSQNETIMARVNEFRRKFDKIKMLNRKEVRLVRRRGFRAVFSQVAEAKRDVARTMTDCIQPIADFCVDGEKKRKEFVLNTLLTLEATLDFVCGMNESHFKDIYEWQAGKCLSRRAQQLQNCQRKSFNLYFWERIPERLTTVQLLNGAVCNFDFDTMLDCSTDAVKGSSARSCSNGAVELLAYQFDVIKRSSLCFKKRILSDIIDDSSEDFSTVVS